MDLNISQCKQKMQYTTQPVWNTMIFVTYSYFMGRREEAEHSDITFITLLEDMISVKFMAKAIIPGSHL